jgi:hypothetical protein
LQSGEDGATLPFLHPIVSTSIEDNDVSSFIGPSLHLHASLGAWRRRCRLEDAKNFGKILRKLVKSFSKA